MAKRGIDTHNDAIVIGADHDRLLPLSRPSSRAKMAATSTTAPGKSTRRNLVVQCDFSMSGSFKTKATVVNAKMQMGTCPMKDLKKKSARVDASTFQLTSAIQWCLLKIHRLLRQRQRQYRR